jgi:hypothetical protein
LENPANREDDGVSRRSGVPSNRRGVVFKIQHHPLNCGEEIKAGTDVVGHFHKPADLRDVQAYDPAERLDQFEALEVSG